MIFQSLTLNCFTVILLLNYSFIFISSYHIRLQTISKIKYLNHNNDIITFRRNKLFMASSGRGGGSTKLDKKTCK